MLMIDDKVSYLEKIHTFEGLSPLELESLGEDTRLVHYPTGYLFYMPDDPAEVMFILKVGRVQLYRISNDGRKLILAILEAGAIFGHMAIIGQRLRHTYAESLEPCTICIWRREDVEHVLTHKPAVTLRFLEAVGERLTQVEARFTDMAFKRVSARVASLLLSLHEAQGQSGCVIGYTHQALADMLGVYRETISQTLKEFKRQGWVMVERKRIVLLEIERLRQEAMI